MTPMPDAYEQAKLQQRREREHVARRWAIVSGIAIAALLVALMTSTFLRSARRQCGVEFFGWSGRSCTLVETWTWLTAGASMEFWGGLGFSILVVTLIQLFRDRG